MNLRNRNSKSGGVLVAALVVCIVIGVMLVAYLAMVTYQHRFSQRSQVWNNSIAMCEVGVEEALAHINHINTTSNFAVNGWVSNNFRFRKERTLNGGNMIMIISNDFPPTLMVTGILSSPIQSAPIVRQVRVKTMINLHFPNGILSKGTVSLGGSGMVDSFNSTNSSESTGGMYDPTKRTDRVTVATTAKTAGAISVGNVSIFGSAATGPGGTINIQPNGNVGDAAYNNNPAYNGQIEGGHSANDVNVYIPDAQLPTDFNLLAPTPMPGPVIVGVGITNYAYILNSGDYRMNTPMNLVSTDKILVTGKVRLYCTAPVSFSGQSFLLIGTNGVNSNASIEWYVNASFSLGGGGAVNGTGQAKNLTIYGLNNCLSLSYSGNSAFVGTIYAPRANITVSGTADASGAFVGNTFTLSGGMSIHYDESLKGDPRKNRFVAASWQEL
jgi:Tfp pilus assembly protein PilX